MTRRRQHIPRLDACELRILCDASPVPVVDGPDVPPADATTPPVDDTSGLMDWFYGALNQGTDNPMQDVIISPPAIAVATPASTAGAAAAGGVLGATAAAADPTTQALQAIDDALQQQFMLNQALLDRANAWELSQSQMDAAAADAAIQAIGAGPIPIAVPDYSYLDGLVNADGTTPNAPTQTP